MSREADERKERERMAIEPTIPATDVRAGVPDFSSERPGAEAGPGRGTVGVIVGVVVIVGALFLWLGGSKPAPAAATTAAPPSAPAPAAAAKPSTSAARPAAKPAAKPTATAAATPTPAAAPTVAAPASDPATGAPSTHAHAAAHKRHKKPPARVAKHKEVKLPRLPSPPPADP